MDQGFVPLRLRSATGNGFPASARVLAWDGVQVSALANPSVHAQRTPKLIRKSDPESYQVSLVAEGETMIRQSGREAHLSAGQFTVLDTSRPFESRRSSSRLDSPSISLLLSRALLPLPANRIDRLTAVPFSAHHGVGALFARWLVDLTARAGEFTPADAPTLTSVTVDLLSAALAAPLEAQEILPPDSRRRCLRLQIDSFIEQRLGDPALTPKAVADAHHISLRTLQKLFAADATTPAAWIRRHRLERCRRDLANPLLRSRPIHAIAARWGFTDPAHFSRVFRTAFGLPPSDYRHITFSRD
ncbi:AraC-like ligand-binding domain-containing protein [Nocardia sp. Marseille-Q1738]